MGAKDKLEMELKPFEKMCEDTKKHLEDLICGADGADPTEIKCVAEALGEIVDVKKDMVEICYKMQIIEAMEEEKEENPRLGYNNRRYANGRYAPSGRGMMGYMPHMDEEVYEREYMRNPDFKENMRMGYREMNNHNDRYGAAYNGYRQAKRYYTETHDQKEKMKMDDHTKDHLRDTIDTVKEMWKDADQSLRIKMKEDMTKLVQEMVV